MIYRPDGTQLSKTVFHYDHKGNEIQLLTYLSNGALKEKIDTSYLYDAVGNWIKRTSTWAIKDGKPGAEVTTTERKIKYYHPTS